VRALSVWLCAVLLAASAQAQDSALVLEVRAARVEREQFERALREELASDRAAGEAPAAGRLELSERGDDLVHLSYRDASGKETTRELRIERDDPEALEKITLAAANLVRDQSALPGELAALAAARPAPPPAPPSPPPPPPPPPPPAHDPCTTTPVRVFGGDFAPGVGTSGTQAGRDAARRLSINAVGSFSAGVRGFEASLGFNIGRRGACGFQGALGFNLAQGEVYGAQLASVNLALGQVRGAQLGFVNYTRRRAIFQLGAVNAAIEGAGTQLGAVNFARGVTGFQAGVTNLAQAETGAQLGVVNLAWDELRRAQVGVVNLSRRARAPVGVISVVREGRSAIDAWISENGTLLAALEHGGDIIHNIYGAGARVGAAGTRVVVTVGLGGRLFRDRLLALDLDALYELMMRPGELSADTMLGRLRLNAAITIYDRLALLVGAGYAVMDTTDPDERTQAPFAPYEIARYGGNEQHVLYGFPSFSAGLRVALGASR
jgi:hypothetical protein